MITTIVLAEDHHIVRQGLRALLEAESDFRLVGETGDGLEVVSLVDQLQPNVLLLDLMMPGLSGLEITRRVRQSAPGVSIIILSMYATEAYVLEALRSGASGYVLKDVSFTELVKAVRAVMDGQRYLSPPLSEWALQAYVEKSKDEVFDAYETLTAREREVLHMVAEGLSSSDIAKRLFISSRTVETHRANMMRKLGLRSQTDLVRYALRRGIIPIDD